MTTPVPKVFQAAPGAAVMARIAEIADADAGLDIPADKGSMIHSRLFPRLRLLGLASYEAYIDYVSRPDGAAERAEMIGALTTNVTHFFRERHHFDFLRTRILPSLAARIGSGGRVRLWSAGCASGEEAYSIAMTLADAIPDMSHADIRVLGTDIDARVIRTARAARYASSCVGPVPQPVATRWLRRDEEGYAVREEIRRLVRFGVLNLHAPWPMQGKFDVIFCRNVMIYFSRERQAALAHRFAAALTPGGWLVLGHSERLSGATARRFALEGITSYRLIGQDCLQSGPDVAA
ncbi:MAG: protein-glutamate O-methyltransferase [Rhodobacteraceae bacterium]|nr:protein-glutamate O-methyltransferase [Paracoccaceae bacterium]